MSNGSMTTKATGLFVARVRMRTFDRLDDLLMAFPARLLCNDAAVIRNAYVVVEPTGGEVIRMPKAVSCFGGVLANEIWRSVTVVANGDVPMARLQPCAVLLVHDMAVCASLWIVSHV